MGNPVGTEIVRKASWTRGQEGEHRGCSPAWQLAEGPVSILQSFSDLPLILLPPLPGMMAGRL